jgi:uncharacterized SAM-binding protein YcdF (DUF218 family)
VVRTAIVIPGHHTQRRCVPLVREAERVAAERAVDLVVFTGWARRGGLTEADQMRAAWRGPDVELVVEPTASVTAENATRTLPLLLERGIGCAIVVCAPLHLYRARFFFTQLYGAYGVETEFRVARLPLSVGAVLWEVAAATACRRQLRTARSELAQVVR